MNDPAHVRDDFDRIALLPEIGGPDHNARYHAHLLRHVPPGCRLALDIGCGQGAFARELARRCERVVGIDLSPNMIRIAREQSRDFPNIDFDVADVMRYDLGDGRFDCIASIATLHHLPLADLLPWIARALRPGGALLVLDLCRSTGLRDRALDCAALAATAFTRLFRSAWRVPANVRRAWRDHGVTDRYVTLPEVRACCKPSLPGAVVRRQLMWRYSLIWNKHPSDDR
jgi:SAM-dependent methyltransferase